MDYYEYIPIECPSNTTIVPTLAATRPHQNQDNNSNNSLFRRLTSNSQYQSYATALTVTIAVGCFLLLLNVFIFAAIYYQREKRATYTKKKEELTEAEHHHSSSSPSLERYQQKGSRKSSLQSVSGTTFGEYSCYDEKIRCKEKRALVDLCTVELPMQEYKYSPPCGSTTGSIRRSITPENYGNKHTMMDSTTQDSYTKLPTYSTPQINDSNNLVTYRSVLVLNGHCFIANHTFSHFSHHHHWNSIQKWKKNLFRKFFVATKLTRMYDACQQKRLN